MRIQNDFSSYSSQWAKMVPAAAMRTGNQSAAGKSAEAPESVPRREEAESYAPSARDAKAAAPQELPEEELEQETLFQEMDKLLQLSPRTLTGEQKAKIQDFLQSDDFVDYMARLDGGTKDLQLQRSVEDYAGKAALIEKNLSAYFSETPNASALKERVKDSIAEAGAQLAGGIAEAMGERLEVYSRAFDADAFRSSLAEIIGKRAGAYKEAYAAHHITLGSDSFEIRDVMERRSSPYAGISAQHDGLGRMTYRDAVELNDYLRGKEQGGFNAKPSALVRAEKNADGEDLKEKLRARALQSLSASGAGRGVKISTGIYRGVDVKI